MLNKNLRSVLYYVVGVSFICLMIEVSKRSDDKYYSLSKDLYEVKTDDSKFPTDNLPAQENFGGNGGEEVIPKRNRGRTSETDQGENEVEVDLKAKFRDWKKTSGTAGIREKGMFKKWKTENGYTKKEKEKEGKVVNDQDFREWKKLNAISEQDKGAFKKYKQEKGLTKSKPEQEIDAEKKEDTTSEDEKSLKREFMEWKKSNVAEGVEEKGLFKKWKVEKGLNKKSKYLKELENEDDKYEEVTIRPDKQEEVKEMKSRKEELKAEKGEVEENKDEEDIVDLEQEKVTATRQYIQADPNHSCQGFTLTERQQAEAAKVKQACSSLGEEVGGQTRLLSRMRWAVKERLLYCPVFKAASTTWLVNYLKLSNSKVDPKVGNLHTRITNLFPAPATFRLRKQIFEESLKFIIVRHPFERLVSAYRDKLAGYSRNPHYLGMRQLIIQKYRKKPTLNKSTIPTFRESVDFVLDELTAMEEGSSDINIDGHFMPYSRRCMPCGMDYDLVVKFENLEEDSQYIIQQCGLQEKLSVTHENPAPTGPKTDQGYKNKSKKPKKPRRGKGGEVKEEEEGEEEVLVVSQKKHDSAQVALDFFKEIPEHKIKQLYNHYRLDFVIFDYSTEKYLQPASL